MEKSELISISHALNSHWQKKQLKYKDPRACNEEGNYPVIALCNILKLNRSSYYKWLHREQSEQEAIDNELIDYMCNANSGINCHNKMDTFRYPFY